MQFCEDEKENGRAQCSILDQKKQTNFMSCMSIFSKMDSPYVTKVFDLEQFRSACDLGGKYPNTVAICSAQHPSESFLDFGAERPRTVFFLIQMYMYQGTTMVIQPDMEMDLGGLRF